jgi:non-specific serine/threonine protein kinase
LAGTEQRSGYRAHFAEYVQVMQKPDFQVRHDHDASGAGWGPPAHPGLPGRVTRFIGRSQELAETARLLATSRLVTLTGGGGIGKTRLALRSAAQLESQFSDGVGLVELATVRDPDLVAHTVAATLRIRDETARPMMEVLTAALADVNMLLLLDSCEVFPRACADLTEALLRDCPGVHVLATSRQSLGTPNEQILMVPPMDTHPGDSKGPRSDAVALFVDRAGAAGAKFTLTADNEDAVATLCQRLDGIPLAIELAAARTRTLTVEQIITRLSDRFALLNDSDPASSHRHQTLRAAIGWSHELCSPAERLLWTRLAVFPGEFGLDAAVAVCADERLPADSIPELLERLVDKSVLLGDEHAADSRYRMLDTVREFGREWLTALGEEEQLARRHRDFYLALAERFDDDWFGPRQPQWTQRMHADHPNLQAALGYCLANPAETRTGMRLFVALYYFWIGCGAVKEGRYWLDRVLAADPHPSGYRARALATLSRFFILDGDPAAATATARENLALARELHDPVLVSDALRGLGFGLIYSGDAAAAVPLLDEAIALGHQVRETHPTLAFATFTRAFAELFEGNPRRAAELMAESRAISQAKGERWWRSNVLNASVLPALAVGDFAQAGAFARESLVLRRGLEDVLGLVGALEYLAWIAAYQGDHRRAARLLGAVSRHWRAAGGSPIYAGQLRQAHEACEASAREALGVARFDSEFHAGTALTIEDTVNEALAAP